jgi:calcineurin-like phosphoesterase
VVILRFLTGMPNRFETAKGDPRFAAAVIDVDPETGRARGIERMLLGEEDLKAF